MALSSGNVHKYEFLTCQDFLPEKGLLVKAATIKRFKYSPLGSKLKRQSHIEGKQYQGLIKVYKFDKKEGNETIKKEHKNDNEKPTVKEYNRSNLIYNSNRSFYKYYNVKKIDNLSFKSKYLSFNWVF